MFLTSWNLEVLQLSFRQTLQNVAESIEVVPSKSNSPDSTGTMRSLIDIAMVMDALVFGIDEATRRHGEPDGDGSLKFGMRRSSGGWFLLGLYVVLWSSLSTVSGFWLLGLFF